MKNMINIIAIDLKNYGITRNQLIDFSKEYYSTTIDNPNLDICEFSFETNKLLEEFEKVLNSTFKLEKK